VGCSLIAFGEAFVPGYLFWIEHTNGARFNSAPALSRTLKRLPLTNQRADDKAVRPHEG
jgi:hypothetical protein